jgi:ATPase subunit of ABC transporter with duplicated ATPase domains
MMKNPILIFDEPTNHLDLESVSALAEGLSEFPGTVFVVSHDRDLVASVATRIISITPDKFTDFYGTYDEYLESLQKTKGGSKPAQAGRIASAAGVR